MGMEAERRTEAAVIEIECRCGAVGVSLTGAPLAQFYCHCDDCQAAHGAAYVPAAIYRVENVAVTRGAPITWKVKTTPRTTCAQCGTRLFAQPPGSPLCGVVASLLPAGMFTPEFHIHCAF